jgi:hypothetical protein
MSRVTVLVEGGLLPDDLLEKIADGSAQGQRAADFGITSGRLSDEIMRAFSDAQSYWSAFQHRYERASKGGRESTTTVTRESFVIPLLEALGYKLEFKRSLAVGDHSFNISHLAGDDPSAPPVNIVSADETLDERGSARRSAHSTVQEYLNLSDSVWGLATNGRWLRLLRNSSRLAKPRYIEFDLAGMMESNVYSDFHLLYRLLHRTRLPKSAADASECWLEKYFNEGVEQGSRVRDRLRDGVVDALKILGNAFLSHDKSDHLREQILAGHLTAPAFYRELLRLVYRLLFLMVGEERRLMFPESRENEDRRAIFTEHYGVNRLRARVESYVGEDAEIDLWQSVKQTFNILRDDRAAHMLGLAALNGELFGPHGCPHLDGGGDSERAAFCRNDELLRAIDCLSKFDDDGIRRRVNFAALDVEELGSVYESLLEYHPQLTASPPSFDLIWGSERKSTGSYYTPPDLVRELITSALVPVMEERLKPAKGTEEREKAVLSMRVIDPAAGSGHFLLAAARRIGRELAKIRTGEEEPPPSAFRRAVRDVIRECIYAVDKNPLAVDLCKVALWIEAHNAGQPLSFLDHHVKCGDSLVGVFDLKVLQEGIPDDAYKAVEGDNKDAARDYRKRNKQERESGQLALAKRATSEDLAAEFESLSHIDERTPEDVALKERRYAALRARRELHLRQLACDAWTAAFFVPLEPPQQAGVNIVPTTATVQTLRNGGQVHGKQMQEITKAAETFRFFHWPVEFPDVFARGGFDVVLGNPPWERIKLQEKEFFASRDPEIARAASKSARDKALRELPNVNPELFAEWTAAVHAAESQGKFIRESGRCPLCGRGDVNTYSIFAELARALTGPAGRAGIIVPSGIATDDTTKFFFRDLMESRSLASLYDFENRNAIFTSVHRSYKFCLLTIAPKQVNAGAEFVFFALGVDDLRDSNRRILLSANDITLLNPNTRTCPIFRTRRDADITKAIYRRLPVLIKEGPLEENPWGAYYLRLIHYGDHSDKLHTADDCQHQGYRLQGNNWISGTEVRLPVYESKLINSYDHRFASYDSQGDVCELSEQAKRDPEQLPLPKYWVDEEFFAQLVGKYSHDRAWFLAYRDVARSTDTRTMLAVAIPRTPASIKLPILGLGDRAPAICLLANFNSFVLDYVARQSIGGISMSFFVVKQLAVIPPHACLSACPWSARETLDGWITPRVLELTYTAFDMRLFAEDSGYIGPPFRWDEERRFLIRCELDAAFFQLYGISHEDAAYIMETFPIVKRKDEERFGEYRTKRVILETYDAMAEAIRTGRPYQTRLDPPPGDPRAAHPPREAASENTAART